MTLREARETPIQCRGTFPEWLRSTIACLVMDRRREQQRRYEQWQQLQGSASVRWQYRQRRIAAGLHARDCRAYRARKKAYLEELFHE
jgi:hypothetical protein